MASEIVGGSKYENGFNLSTPFSLGGSVRENRLLRDVPHNLEKPLKMPICLAHFPLLAKPELSPFFPVETEAPISTASRVSEPTTIFTLIPKFFRFDPLTGSRTFDERLLVRAKHPSGSFQVKNSTFATWNSTLRQP
jgi:hypothetical protein